MNKRILISASLLMVCAGVFGQQAEVSVLTPDDAYLAGLPRLTMPPGYATRPLPTKKDNTRLIYCPGIYSQEVWNCNQAASVWTMFTYEINYLRNLNSSEADNQYSPMAVYNLLNHGNQNDGVSYFDSWDLIRANGIPGNPDFNAASRNWLVWMTGYDKYYRGMNNRIDQLYAIEVGTPEGLLTLKHWINDHLNGEEVGGVANYQIGSGDMVVDTIRHGLEAEGEYIVVKYGPIVGHAMTFAGWNDEVKYDVNGDGRYTNNVDINGDGVVNMKDWEIGAMLVVNSWGNYWNEGKVWVMYRLLAEDTNHGGIWNNAAMVVKPKKTFQPQLTIKTSIRYNHRSRLRIIAGMASSPDAVEPEHTLDFPCFSFQGDTLPMQGFYGPNADLIEIGLDITPLLQYFPENNQAKIFLDLIQKAPNTRGAGRVESFSVMDYTNGTHEYTCTSGMTDIVDNATTRLSVIASARVNRPVIYTESLADAQVGIEYRTQIEMDVQATPLRFANPATMHTVSRIDESVSMNGGTAIIRVPQETSKIIDLPFAMTLYGQTYDNVTVLSNGAVIMGDEEVIYPYRIDNRLPFYHNCGIYPFFGTLYYPTTGMQVTVELNPSVAIFRWHASVDAAGNNPVNFAAALYPDGRIRYYYGEMNHNMIYTWIAGLSMGNQTDFTLMDYNHAALSSNSAYELEQYNWPSWLSLSSTGDLKGTPPIEGQWQVPLVLTDGYGLTTSKTLVLKTSGFSGTGSPQDISTVRIFPNPVSDEIRIQIQNARPGTLLLEIRDLTGRELIRREYKVRGGEELLRCGEVANLSRGIYVYRVTGVVEGRGKIAR
ncbi:MAG: putative Ig domain-containing protein [Bacteroidota bacterium]